ncbi:MAG: phosphatase PAP2 family protein [Acidobacteria bacterium]|nr:phosphatase PAP2 family protein [Acidobacteriota bacterium]
MEQDRKNNSLTGHFYLIEKIYFFVAIVFFLVLAILALQHKPLAWDIPITCTLQSFSSLETFMRAISLLGDNFYLSATIVISFTLILYYLGYKLEARMLLLITGVAQIANSIIKVIIARPRPAGEICVRLLVQENTLSFPSGHVTHYVCLYGFLCFLIYKKVSNPLLKIILMALPAALVALVGFSRVYLGAHWTSDVTAAYLSASVWLIFISGLYNYFSTKKYS